MDSSSNALANHGCLTEKAALAFFRSPWVALAVRPQCLRAAAEWRQELGDEVSEVLDQLPRGSGISGGHRVCPP